MYIFFRLEELQVLDIKFLFGCSKPTIVVLYQVYNFIPPFVLGVLLVHQIDSVWAVNLFAVFLSFTHLFLGLEDVVRE